MTHAQQAPLTILAIFAHPDDEIGVGSTLAYYSDAGMRTVLTCATRGEAATIFCEDCATRETLAQVRTRELECACQHLGVSELRWLDWPDGRVSGLPRAQAVGQVVSLIRDIRPQIILTHPENGLYPHPDHLAIWEITHEAFTLAADPDAYPDAGPAWGTARLFTRALPQSFFERAPGLAEFRVQLNGQELPFFGTPDDQIDVTMNLEPWVARRMAAWDCHRSQHNPNGFSTTMPDGMRQEMAAHEQYVLAAARMPLPDGAAGDLLAGLDAEQAAGRPPAEASAALITFLRGEVAAHRALAELCQTYQINHPVAKYAGLFKHLAGGQQQSLYLLARVLRQAGQPSGDIEPAPRVLSAGRQQTKAEDRIRYLDAAFTDAAARLAAGRPLLAEHDEQALWQELAALLAEQRAALARGY